MPKPLCTSAAHEPTTSISGVIEAPLHASVIVPKTLAPRAKRHAYAECGSRSLEYIIHHLGTVRLFHLAALDFVSKLDGTGHHEQAFGTLVEEPNKANGEIS